MRSGKNLKYQSINKLVWLGERSPSLFFLTKGNPMTFYHGLGMFLFNMIAFFIGIIIAYIIIKKVDEERKRKEKLEYLKGRRWKEDDTE